MIFAFLVLLLLGCLAESTYLQKVDLRAQAFDRFAKPVNRNQNTFNPFGPFNEGKGKSYEPRTMNDFQTRDSRNGFVRKVYAILSFQLLITIAVTYLIMTNRQLQYWLFTNWKNVSMISVAFSLASVLPLVSSKTVRYTFPFNLVLLGVHSVCQSIMVGTFASLLNPKTVCLG